MPGRVRIEVELERGGCGLIRVRDDGIGIQPQEIGLALARHATSKIASLEDLERVATLGFRGEALPSIASVSRLSLIIALERGGACLERRSARWRAQHARHPPRIRRVPASRCAICSSTCRRGASSCAPRPPNFSTSCACSSVWRCRASRSDLRSCTTARPYGRCRRRPRMQSAWRACQKLCGEEFAAHVIELRHDTEDLRLSGWLASPTFSRSQSDLQFAFLNGRYVRDKLIAGAARLAYQDVLFNGRFCAYVLYLDLDPTMVDVNAHPQKLEVRFRDSRRVHEFMFRTLERALAGTRPTAESPGSAPLDWLTGSARHAGLARAESGVASCCRKGRRAAPPRMSIAASSAKRHSARLRGPQLPMRCAVRTSWAGALPYAMTVAPRERCRAARDMRRSALRSPNCTGSTFWPKPRMAWCWWTCMRRTSASCTRA